MLDYNLLGSRIRALRQQKGLTQSAFAQGLGVSFQAVSNWERGVTPPDLENLVGIASFFGVLVDDLLRQNNAPLYLGIDGGGTKTEFTVVTADGFVHKRVITTGCNPNDIGFHPMWELLSQNIEALLVELPSIKAAFCGIAGITTGNNTAKLQSSLQNRFPQVDFQVKSDAFNLLNMDDRADMALISGTGSVVFVRKGEDYARLGGWGYLLDSAGSAYDIGRSAVQAALAEEDGLLSASLLRKKLLEKLQTNTIWQGLNQIYSGGKPFIAGLATAVFEAANEGDAEANAIIDESCQALARLLTEGVRLHRARPVAIASGGLFQHQSDIMTALIGKYCDVQLITTSLPPVYGACRKAVSMGGKTSPEFSNNFQKTYGGAL